MDPFAYNKDLPHFKTPEDPSLTLDINGTKEFWPLFHNGDTDPTLFAIFDAPEHSLNAFENNELSPPFQEPKAKNDCSFTITGSNTTLDKGLLLTDFDNSSSSPNSQSSRNLNAGNNNSFNKNAEYECSMLDNVSFEDMLGNCTMSEYSPHESVINEITSKSRTDTINHIPSRVSDYNLLTRNSTTQNRPLKKNSARGKLSKIQKPKYYQNSGSQNLAGQFNMELNYILLSEESDKGSLRLKEESDNHCNNNTNNNSNTNTNNDNQDDNNDSSFSQNDRIRYGSNIPLPDLEDDLRASDIVPSQAISHQNIPQSISSEKSITQSITIPSQSMDSKSISNKGSFLNGCYFTTDEGLEFQPPKMNNAKVSRSRRTKCLKKDSTVSLEAKLEYFNRVIESARKNGLYGIFLRDHAATELAINKSEYKTLELKLTNIDSISEILEIMTQGRSESFRTIWKIVRQQHDHKVYLTFQLSDEYATIDEDEMEISIFTLMVPGHATKNLITGCQYLQLVNFILGKDYNHLINDNLAEITIGSDGKMISTQKHHASRVRSHVKKYLKRHVVKDIKRYTSEERSNVSEFHYQMILHNIVMGCTLKKPFESKVSVALMELPNVKYALIKQAEFFVFKRI